MTFEELEQKGNELASRRAATANEGERALLNKEIRSIRQAQLERLKKDLSEGLSAALPTLVQQLINESDVVKQIQELQQGE